MIPGGQIAKACLGDRSLRLVFAKGRLATHSGTLLGTGPDGGIEWRGIIV